MKLKYLFLILIIIILSIIPLSFYFYNNHYVLEKTSIKTSIGVGDSKVMGFNPTSENFNFGKGPQGSIALKHFNVTNNFSFDIKVKIFSKGDFNDWIILSDNNFILKPDEIRNVEIKVLIPNDAIKKEYNGSINFLFIRAII